MEALKKTSVAAMIMVVCIILAIVIGETRKDTFINPSEHESGFSETIFGMSTFGAIQQQVEGGLEDADIITVESEEDTSIPKFGSIIGVVLVIWGLSKIFGGRR